MDFSSTTEGGSSGSGLFVNGVLTGVLSNGTASCSKTGGVNNYSRFDAIFPAIKQWLYPEATGNQASGARTAVYRFYNTQTGVHFYTITESERAHVAATLLHYTYDGIAYYASTLPGTGYTPLYRFFYAARGYHFYTNSAAEKDSIIATLPQYHYEGIGYYVLGVRKTVTLSIR